MKRTTGTYRATAFDGEEVRAFVPHPLPPSAPALSIDGRLARLNSEAEAAAGRLAVAGEMIPNQAWFLYGFVRKEAVITSQIEGTQATLRDVLTFEATRETDRPHDVREVINYVDALSYARREMGRPRGLPLSVRLLCEAHRKLMKGSRGADKLPGEVRRSQNWIGGTRPGNARFVPPPADAVPESMAALEGWIHSSDALPPLVRAGLAHVQFETIHPFLDGNGRIGRLLITLLLEHWGVLPAPLLYLSASLKRRQEEYYRRLSAVRTDGDWEGWTEFFLECVREAADDGVAVARAVFALMARSRRLLTSAAGSTVASIRLLDLLPDHPIVTVQHVMDLLAVSKPTAIKNIAILSKAGVLKETTGRARSRVYAFQAYLKILTGDAG